MGTTAYGGKGSKGRAANGDPPVGAASCKREQYTKATCQKPPPPTRKGKDREGRIGQGGRGRSLGGERPMGTTAYGGQGSKGRAANGDQPVGAASCRREQQIQGNILSLHRRWCPLASCRREQHTMATCQIPHPPPLSHHKTERVRRLCWHNVPRERKGVHDAWVHCYLKLSAPIGLSPHTLILCLNPFPL